MVGLGIILGSSDLAAQILQVIVGISDLAVQTWQLRLCISDLACRGKPSASAEGPAELLAAFVRHHVPQLPFCSLAVAHSAESGVHEDLSAGQTAVIAVGGAPLVVAGGRTTSPPTNLKRIQPRTRSSCLMAGRRTAHVLFEGPALYSDRVRAPARA